MTTTAYDDIQWLANGSSGSVWLVHSKLDGKKYCKKVVNMENFLKKDVVRAMAEVSVMAAMNHPFIIQHKESFVEEGKLIQIMEFAEGGDLEQRIRFYRMKGRFIEEEQIFLWFTQLCLALKHLHDRKVLHRDLKTQNVFLSAEGDVRLGDFGLTCVLNATGAAAQTRLGTPYYMSPELIQTLPYNAKSDMWSLGCVLYKLCALKHPFSGDNIQSLMKAVLTEKTPRIPSKYSKDMHKLVYALLQKNPHDRPSINQLLRTSILRTRCRELLATDVYRDEFSHTVLHVPSATVTAPGPEGAAEGAPDGIEATEGMVPLAGQTNTDEVKDNDGSDESDFLINTQEVDFSLVVGDPSERAYDVLEEMLSLVPDNKDAKAGDGLPVPAPIPAPALAPAPPAAAEGPPVDNGPTLGVRKNEPFVLPPTAHEPQGREQEKGKAKSSRAVYGDRPPTQHLSGLKDLRKRYLAVKAEREAAGGGAPAGAAAAGGATQPAKTSPPRQTAAPGVAPFAPQFPPWMPPGVPPLTGLPASGPGGVGPGVPGGPPVSIPGIHTPAPPPGRGGASAADILPGWPGLFIGADGTPQMMGPDGIPVAFPLQLPPGYAAYQPAVAPGAVPYYPPGGGYGGHGASVPGGITSPRGKPAPDQQWSPRGGYGRGRGDEYQGAEGDGGEYDYGVPVPGYRGGGAGAGWDPRSPVGPSTSPPNHATRGGHVRGHGHSSPYGADGWAGVGGHTPASGHVRGASDGWGHAPQSDGWGHAPPGDGWGHAQPAPSQADGWGHAQPADGWAGGYGPSRDGAGRMDSDGWMTQAGAGDHLHGRRGGDGWGGRGHYDPRGARRGGRGGRGGR